MSDALILVAETRSDFRQSICEALEESGFRAQPVDNEPALWRALDDLSPGALVLDTALRAPHGLDLCREARDRSDIPIILVGARSTEVDRVIGLELGADDYVTKPFSNRELMARVRNMLRRSASDGPSASSDAETLASGDLVVDLTGHTVTLQDQPLDVKPREFNLLALLVANKGRAFTRDQILERLWGHDYIGDTRTVDVHIRWLREKIEPDPATPQRIKTIRGVGYRFDG